ncbi:chloride channel protein, partial [Acinetobacter baumannii]
MGGVVFKRVLGLWTLLIKIFGLPLSVGSGLSVGKEGPMCHIAACVGNVTCRYFPGYKANYTKTNEILSAACAAGVACAFGAPIGGI